MQHIGFGALKIIKFGTGSRFEVLLTNEGSDFPIDCHVRTIRVCLVARSHLTIFQSDGHDCGLRDGSSKEGSILIIYFLSFYFVSAKTESKNLCSSADLSLFILKTYPEKSIEKVLF